MDNLIIIKTERFVKLLILLSLFFFSCADKENKTTNETKKNSLIKQKIDSIGNYYMNQNGPKGFSIAVLRGTDTVYNGSFGYVDSLSVTKTTNKHSFEIGSITKLMTATVAMKLVDEGKLSLDQTLHELLPDFPNIDQAKKIKLSHLLSNTSGIKDYALVIDSVFLKMGVSPKVEDYYNFFDKNKLNFEPGSQYSYSNSGFWLAARIIERATGKTYDEEIDRVINRPTGLNLKPLSEAVNESNFSAYFDKRDGLRTTEPWTWLSGDGGLTTTAIDLAHFPYYWSNGTIISKESFKRMSEPYVFNNRITSGYGIGVRNGIFASKHVIGHTGGGAGTHAVMMFFPDDNLSVVVLHNTDASSIDALEIIAPVANAALNLEEFNLEEHKLEYQDLSAFEGKYEQWGYVDFEPTVYIITFNKEEGFLLRKKLGSNSSGQRLYLVGENEFAYKGYPMDRYIFELDSTGRPMAYKLYYSGIFKRMGFRKE